MHTQGSDPRSFVQRTVQQTGQRTAQQTPPDRTHTASDFGFVVTEEGHRALAAYDAIDEPIPYVCVERGADLDSVPPAGWIV